MSDSLTHATGFARLASLPARAVLGAVLLAAGLGVAVTFSPLGSTNLLPWIKGGNDVALYRAEVERIHHGEGYYQAAAAELTPRGYPTRSVFNWRTPLPMWLLGKLPAVAIGKVLLGGLALLVLLMAIEALARDGNIIRLECGDLSPLSERPRNVASRSSGKVGHNATLAKTPESGDKSPHSKEIFACFGTGYVPALTALLLTGALLPTVLDDLFVVPVLWAGVLIALSFCAYGLNRPYLGVALGLAAVFFRELALPYCLLAAGIAWWHGRRGELAAWLLGLMAWSAFFAWHWWRVSGLITPGATAHQHGWIQLGGAGFVISTAQMNAYLLLLPQWVTALYLVAALVGFAGWSTPLGTRIGLTTCLFLAAFAAVGQSFNQYWGSLVAPLLCFGVARFPASLADLCRAAGKPALESPS